MSWLNWRKLSDIQSTTAVRQGGACTGRKEWDQGLNPELHHMSAEQERRHSDQWPQKKQKKGYLRETATITNLNMKLRNNAQNKRPSS